MTARILRSAALVAGAGVLVLGAAGPAMAADPLPLPNKASLVPPASVTVTTTLAGACAVGEVPAAWTWTTRVVGQRSGVVQPTAPVSCVGDVVTWTVTSQEPTTKKKKANAVVKFIATEVLPADSVESPERRVFTLVVKVNHKAGKPA